MQIAPNGNSTGANDTNFIHFAEEQAGTLLPNAPGYPFYLPSLQISPSGRLCFWNFPNKIFRSVASNPANAGTTDYLRDAKSATSKNLFPPIPGDLGTNGSSNQYFWGACDSYFIVKADYAQEVINQHVLQIYLGNAVSNPNLTLQSVYDNFVNDPGNIHFIPEVGKYNDDTVLKTYPWYWIEYNIQYYINQFLKIPYDVSVSENPQYGASWTGTLSAQSEKGNLAQWLGGANFFVNLVAHPDALQSIANALPVLILTAATIVSGGLASPALAAIIAADKSAATKDAQNTALINQVQKGGNVNSLAVAQTTGIGAAVSTISEGEWIFFAFGFLILILVIIFYKNK